MKKHLFFLLIFAVTLLAGCTKDVEPDYSNEFVGTWKGVSITQNGQKTMIANVPNSTVLANISRVSDNKVKMQVTFVIAGSVQNMTTNNTFTVKRYDENRLELIEDITGTSQQYIKLDKSISTLVIGGYSSGTAIEIVFSK